MISLRKYLDKNTEVAFQQALAEYCATLAAIGESGHDACPPLGPSLCESLERLRQALEAEPTPAAMSATGHRAQVQLRQWGVDAAEYFRQRTGEAKELMLILAQTAEIIGERDQRYTTSLRDFTGRLETIADLHDLAEIRDSLVQSANELKHYAEAMAAESHKTVAKLQNDVRRCKTKLGDVERLAATDPLTGLENRRSVETEIKLRMSRSQLFSVIVLDLNSFKQVNDNYGHMAGDEVLAAFGKELRAVFRGSDIVGRWGGDEFIVLVDGSPQEAFGLVDRITMKVFRDYTIKAGDVARKVHISAAIGIAGLRAGDTFQTLLERADAAMYRSKRGGADSARA